MQFTISQLQATILNMRLPQAANSAKKYHQIAARNRKSAKKPAMQLRLQRLVAKTLPQTIAIAIFIADAMTLRAQ